MSPNLLQFLTYSTCYLYLLLHLVYSIVVIGKNVQSFHRNGASLDLWLIQLQQILIMCKKFISSTSCLFSSACIPKTKSQTLCHIHLFELFYSFLNICNNCGLLELKTLNFMQIFLFLLYNTSDCFFILQDFCALQNRK